MKQRPLNKRINEILAPVKWEAPDRNFIGHRDILMRSLARYEFVAKKLLGRVLEIGCGRGYSLDILDRKEEYVGLDVSFLFLSDARIRYPAAAFTNASGDLLPFSPKIFDTVIAFEVIEHLPDPMCFLREISRVIHRPGRLFISTPNRLVVSKDSNTPLDRFHLHEFTVNEFYDVIVPYFSSITIWGQFDNRETLVTSNRLINSVPEKWKYWMPAFINGILSVLLRKQISSKDILFTQNNLNSADTFVAICSLE